MAAISESLVSLRIAGDSLSPEKITSLLGVQPSRSNRKGEAIPTQGGREFHYRTGGWSLHAEDRSPENIESQVEELFAQLPREVSIWIGLSNEFQIDLFCGLFMNQTNEGLCVSPKLMHFLSERGIELNLDIYGPANSKTSEPTA